MRVILEFIVCSVFITNGFKCFICSVNKHYYLLDPGLICYNTMPVSLGYTEKATNNSPST